MIRAAVVVCAVLAGSVVAQDNCQGTPNMHDIFEDAPTFVRDVPNGARYVTGPASMSPQLSVIHVSGTPYQQGVAYGALMKDEINELMPEAYDYIYAQIAQYVKFLPPEVQKIVEEVGVAAALDFVYEATKPHTPDHFKQRIQGMANSTGLDYDYLFRITLFPSLIKASCSMFGAWGPATSKTDSGLVQLRALDWTTDGPFQKYPLVIVYHPTDGHDYMVLTWAGLVGAITAYSSAGMAVSEKVWLHYTGKSTSFGIPFHFLLEDIAHYDMDTDQALSRIASANRTCSIFIGIGDQHNNEFKAVEYSKDTVSVFNDRNYPYFGASHPQLDSVVFVDKHTQPSSDPCLGSLMSKYYGSLDAVTTLRYITSQFQTGDMHIAITDFENGMWYVSNASPVTANGTVVNAYDNPFIRLNATSLFAMRV